MGVGENDRVAGEIALIHVLPIGAVGAVRKTMSEPVRQCGARRASRMPFFSWSIRHLYQGHVGRM